MKAVIITVNDRDLIDLIGNVDVSMLVDKIIEHDMKASGKKINKKIRKIIIILLSAILSVISVILTIFYKSRKQPCKK